MAVLSRLSIKALSLIGLLAAASTGGYGQSTLIADPGRTFFSVKAIVVIPTIGSDSTPAGLRDRNSPFWQSIKAHLAQRLSGLLGPDRIFMPVMTQLPPETQHHEVLYLSVRLTTTEVSQLSCVIASSIEIERTPIPNTTIPTARIDYPISVELTAQPCSTAQVARHVQHALERDFVRPYAEMVALERRIEQGMKKAK